MKGWGRAGDVAAGTVQGFQPGLPSTGSSPPPVITMGIVLVAFLTARNPLEYPPATTMISALRLYQLGCKLRGPIALSLLHIVYSMAMFLSFYVATLASEPSRIASESADSRARSVI